MLEGWGLSTQHCNGLRAAANSCTAVLVKINNKQTQTNPQMHIHVINEGCNTVQSYCCTVPRGSSTHCFAQRGKLALSCSGGISGGDQNAHRAALPNGSSHFVLPKLQRAEGHAAWQQLHHEATSSTSSCSARHRIGMGFPAWCCCHLHWMAEQHPGSELIITPSPSAEHCH